MIFNEITLITDASYRKDLSGAILKLQENGRIGELRDKWWKQKRGGDTCDVRY
jgi:glutamate receptor, ionotropic, invertebrate